MFIKKTPVNKTILKYTMEKFIIDMLKLDNSKKFKNLIE